MGQKTKKSTEIALTENARKVLESRYFLKNTEGLVVEDAALLFERVAVAVSQVEKRDKNMWASEFFRLMSELRFLPNSPTLMNAGKPEGQLSACFVLPIEDDLEQIFETLKHAALIHQSGGGTGFSFSRLRAKGSVVKSSQGVASGPVSFMRIFDTATETIKQGGTRRGANMAVLRVDHPDVLEFIEAKRDMRTLVNFNISVSATDEFMRAVGQDRKFAIRDPRTGKEISSIRARDLFSKLTQSAWECGDPGMVFIDRINQFNPTPQLGPMESTNPCGEQPLLPYESCNLGSMNIAAYLKAGALDWKTLRQDIHTCVRFLDNVIDANFYPVPECEKITLRNRKIGLGIMGFADLLLEMGLPYDSHKAVALGEKLMSFLDREAKSASAELAEKRGAFANWKGSLWERLGYPKLRNATVSTIAPTGTISMIAGVSSGIEPIFSGIFFRNVLSGARLSDVHPRVKQILDSKGIAWDKITEDQIAKELGAAWRPAGQVSVEDHVRMQAVFQRYSDSAVSKTINLPESATREDVENAYLLAYRVGCKGITVYRDKSRPTQVLEKPASALPSVGAMCPDC